MNLRQFTTVLRISDAPARLPGSDHADLRSDWHRIGVIGGVARVVQHLAAVHLASGRVLHLPADARVATLAADLGTTRDQFAAVTDSPVALLRWSRFEPLTNPRDALVRLWPNHSTDLPDLTDAAAAVLDHYARVHAAVTTGAIPAALAEPQYIDVRLAIALRPAIPAQAREALLSAAEAGEHRLAGVLAWRQDITADEIARLMASSDERIRYSVACCGPPAAALRDAVAADPSPQVRYVAEHSAG